MHRSKICFFIPNISPVLMLFVIGYGVICPVFSAIGQDSDQAQSQTQEGTQQQAEATENANQQPKLTIGSKAPALDIEHWVSNGKGKFSEVKEFEKDRVYVIEFWATWCPPCVASIPHLAELQEKFIDKKVQIISVSDEDLDTIKKFLGKEVPRKETTFNEITQVYSLTTDPDGSVHEDYMEASGEQGIPTAFIVGKTGLIEWIGHPMELDEPLQKVIDDQWDRNAFAELRKMDSQDLEEKFNAFVELFEEASALAEGGDVEEALAVLDKAIEDEPLAQWKDILNNAKLQFTIAYVGGPAALDAFKKLVEAAAEDAEEIGGLVLLICDLHEEKPQDEELLKQVRKTAEKVAAEDKKTIEIHYGLGRILYIHKEYQKSLLALEKTAKLIDAYVPEFEEEQEWIEELEEELIDWIAKVKELAKQG